MDKHEAGKQKAEQFITKVVRSMKQDGAVDAFLWWPEILPELGGAGRPNDTTVPLRMYKGLQSSDFHLDADPSHAGRK